MRSEFDMLTLLLHECAPSSAAMATAAQKKKSVLRRSRATGRIG